MRRGARRKEEARHDAISPRKDRERKYRLLEQRNSEYAAKLDRTFTSHLAAAIQASSPTERKQALEEATKVYEGALDEALRSVSSHFRLPECAE